MNTSIDPATRIKPEAGLENTPVPVVSVLATVISSTRFVQTL
jgi:hypothetical protein